MVEMNRNRSKETKDIANNIDGLVINQVTLHLYKAIFRVFPGNSESLQIET